MVGTDFVYIVVGLFILESVGRKYKRLFNLGSGKAI
jgi:hypothetical protein